MRALVILTLSLLTSPAFAIRMGHETGNGGGAWLCQDTRVRGFGRMIIAADLYEAKRRGHNIKTPSCDSACIEDYVLKRIQKTSPRLYSAIATHTPDLSRLTRFTETSLPEVPDRGYVVGPNYYYCEGSWVQVAIFVSESELILSKSAWQDPAFKDPDKAAILIHERVYKALRHLLGDQNSARTRDIVGLLFSDKNDDEVSREIERMLNFGKFYEGDDGITIRKDYLVNCDMTVSSVNSTKSALKKTWTDQGKMGSAYFGEQGFEFEIESVDPKDSLTFLSIRSSESGRSVSLSGTQIHGFLKKSNSIALELETENKKALIKCQIEIRK